MTELTPAQLTANADEMATALVMICQAKQIRPADAALIIGAACAGAMAQFEGHVGAVETLRLLADVAERELLRAN